MGLVPPCGVRLPVGTPRGHHPAISPQSPRNLPAISPASSAPSPTACTSAPQVARLAPPQSIIAAAAAERDRTNKAGPLRPLPPSDFDKKPAGKQVGGFGSSCSDRFAGPDSRYKKGWRQSTMPILDDSVYRAKHIDPNAPLPKVASLAQPGEKPVIIPSNERFVGPDSIYTVPAGPAAGPGAYDPAALKPASTGPAFDKPGAERFVGPDSIYTVPAGPAAGPGAYDPAAPKPAATGPAFDKPGAERFSGHQSIYRKVHQKSAHHLQPPPTALPLLVAHADWRYAHCTHVHTAQPTARGSITTCACACRQGLRRSTIPTQQCSDLPVKPAIVKAPAGEPPPTMSASSQPHLQSLAYSYPHRLVPAWGGTQGGAERDHGVQVQPRPHPRKRPGVDQPPVGLAGWRW